MIPRFEPTATLAETAAFLAEALSTRPASGGTVGEFEREFAGALECSHAVFVPSGRVGLWLVLKALGYPEGSEVVVPAFTYFAIPAMVRYAGLEPVCADVDPSTYELSPASVASVLSSKTRAVIPTHLFGRTCDMDGLRRLCEPRGVDLIEDCAQACGAVTAGGKAGSLGRAAYFTFGITKNFTTFSGAMAVCHESDVERRMRDLMEDFVVPRRFRLLKEGVTAVAMRMATRRALFNLSVAPLLRLGGNDGPDAVHRAFEEELRGMDDAAMHALKWRPTEAQARAGLRQLRTLDAKNEARRRHGEALLGLLCRAGLAGLPESAEQAGDHIYMSFAVTRDRRFRFAAELRRLGVDVSPGYMSDCSASEGGAPCPGSTSVAARILHLPLYPGLRTRDIERVAAAVALADGRALGAGETARI
ncbi:DegT/DnrJ/EryC1/StrS family aminotransferase [Verrucomicrobiota bacterium]